MPLSSKGYYEKSERQKIVDYIIEKNLYFKLRGKAVWIEMENMQICPGRSWQSMKQHFHTNIINSLDTFQIPNEEKKRIYDCYYKIYLPTKRKRIPSSSTTEAEIEHSTPKKIKTQTSDVENDVEKSPELINSCIRNITHEHNIFNAENVEDAQKSEYEEIVGENLNSLGSMNAEDKDASGQDLDSSIPYSEEEDKNIIIYIKENMNWNDLEYFDEIYENCHEQVLLKRSTTSIKNRFLNVILPNLYNYSILNVEEIVLFYDRAGIDLSPELQEILNNLLANNEYPPCESTSNYSAETRDHIINVSSKQNGNSFVNNNTSNYNTALKPSILNSMEDNKNDNSLKNSNYTTQRSEKETNLENKLDFSAKNHTDQDNCGNNMLQKQNSFNYDKENDNSISKKSNELDTLANYENAIVKYKSKENVKNTRIHQESVEKLHTENIEHVTVQANVANNKFLSRFVAGQLCLNINNEEHAFISDSINNKHDILNELQLKHNIKIENIHKITDKLFIDLKKIKILNDKLEKKILNIKNGNTTKLLQKFEVLQLNLDKIQSFGYIDCGSKINDEKLPAPVALVNKRQKRIIHLPVNLKHLKNNTHLQSICKCCTEVQPSRGKKSKKRKKKTSEPNQSNDNAESSTNDKTNDMGSNFIIGQLYENVVFEDFLNNSSNVGAEMNIIDAMSDHSSPIISMARRKIQLVDINSLMAKKTTSCNATFSENIVNNSHISNINSPPKSTNDNNPLSINFDTEKICDMKLLKNSSNFNHNLNDPINSSNIPYLNNSTHPSILENNFGEELISDSKLDDKNNNTPEEENNCEKRDEKTIIPIVCDELNGISFSNCETDDEISNSEEELNLRPGIEMQKQYNDLCISTGPDRMTTDNSFDPPIISQGSTENFYSCVETLSQESQNFIKEEIQQAESENSVEEVNLLQAPDISNCSVKDELFNFLWSPKENSFEIQLEVDKNKSFTCNNNVLRKTKNTYENKILLFKKSKNDEQNIESPHEVPIIALESLNKQCAINIDLNDDTSTNDITLPLIFHENSTLGINSAKLSEIRLSKNIEEREISDSSHPETSKSIPVLVTLNKNHVEDIRKYTQGTEYKN